MAKRQGVISPPRPAFSRFMTRDRCNILFAVHQGAPFVGDDASAHNLLPKGRPFIMRYQQLSATPQETKDNFPSYRSFAYSAWASLRIGMSGSASFHNLKNSS